MKNRLKDYVKNRLSKLKENRKDIPRTCPAKRREVAIRQIEGRILELKMLRCKIPELTLSTGAVEK